MDCTRCNTDTTRPALSFGAVESPDPLGDYEDTNGVIWLCDGCIDDFKDFLDDDTDFEFVTPSQMVVE